MQHVLELQAMEATDQDHLPEVVNGSTISLLLCQDDF
ncbi:SapB/AmfS family lanthipeptide [Lentzea sp. NBRC 102530]|nr:SapB/AmfS family lanthipeptide [Lentzea sp. NBRC 102530]